MARQQLQKIPSRPLASFLMAIVSLQDEINLKFAAILASFEKHFGGHLVQLHRVIGLELVGATVTNT